MYWALLLRTLGLYIKKECALSAINIGNFDTKIVGPILTTANLVFDQFISLFLPVFPNFLFFASINAPTRTSCNIYLCDPGFSSEWQSSTWSMAKVISAGLADRERYNAKTDERNGESHRCTAAGVSRFFITRKTQDLALDNSVKK